MKRQSISRIPLMATPVMIVCGLLGASSSAWADDGNMRCTNHILLGSYGFAIEGLILTNPGAPLPPGGWLPVRGVAMTNFDGKGNLTQVDHVLVSGVPPPVEWTAGSGTYSVNPDCTGTAVINVPGNPFSPVKMHFVVVRQGKEIHTVVEANAVTSVGIKIE
jgi:hypothetical protein